MQVRNIIADFLPWLVVIGLIIDQQVAFMRRDNWIKALEAQQANMHVDFTTKVQLKAWLKELKRLNNGIVIPNIEE